MGVTLAKFIFSDFDDYITYEEKGSCEGSIVSYDTDFILGEYSSAGAMIERELYDG